LGHEGQFAPPRLSDGSAFREETFAARCGNEEAIRRGKPRLYENIWAVGIFMGTNIKPQASYKGFIYRVISVYIKSAYGHIYGLYWLFI